MSLFLGSGSSSLKLGSFELFFELSSSSSARLDPYIDDGVLPINPLSEFCQELSIILFSILEYLVNELLMCFCVELSDIQQHPLRWCSVFQIS
ncbi:hypothetical protein HanRHA438_Chr09g0428111 [Helianthus annuus]|nr:hypothetical protein HanRHA438_Chr09g0428111 [Helianthus annuus]